MKTKWHFSHCQFLVCFQEIKQEKLQLIWIAIAVGLNAYKSIYCTTIVSVLFIIQYSSTVHRDHKKG